MCRLLDTYPNLYVDIAARISELGRRPYAARRFLIDYADRILFGTDNIMSGRGAPTYFRFLETDDEYFPYARRTARAAGTSTASPCPTRRSRKSTIKTPAAWRPPCRICCRQGWTEGRRHEIRHHRQQLYLRLDARRGRALPGL